MVFIYLRDESRFRILAEYDHRSPDPLDIRQQSSRLHGVAGKVSFSKDATTKWWYIYGFRDRAETRGEFLRAPLFRGSHTGRTEKERRSQGGRGGIRFCDAADSSLTQYLPCSYTRENSRNDRNQVLEARVARLIFYA